MHLPQALFTPQTAVPVDLIFRLAHDDDLRPLYQTFHPHKPYPQFRNWYHKLMKWQRNGRCYWLIGEIKEVPVANGQLLIYPHSAEIANLEVIPEQQNKGVGTGLIDLFLAIARHIALDGLEIAVDIENKNAFALYERLGFVPDREVPLTGQETAVILYKSLRQEPNE